MKAIRLIFFLTVIFTGVSLAQKKQVEGFKTLKIGDPAPNFKLPSTDGKTYELADFDDADVLLVYFTGTYCPTSNAVEPRLQKLRQDMKDKSFGVVAINPNNNDGLRPDEFSYSYYDESFEDSKRFAEDLKWDFPYLYDGNEQITARAYGCLATPHIFIFDKERKLRYQGRFDDSRFAEAESVKKQDARNAVEAIFANKPVPVENTRPIGCSTKWKEKSVAVAESAKKWNDTPAVVKEMDLAAIKSVLGKPSGRHRLVNIWATWCGPCVKEMPDLTDLSRTFSNRNFDFITISIDQPSEKKKVEAALGKYNAVMSAKQTKVAAAAGRDTNNFIYTDSDTDALAEAIDTEWPGPIPYTILINGEGKIVYRHSGVINKVELRKTIVDSMGIYFTR